MNYIKISESNLFCGICDKYEVGTIVVDDILLDYLLGLSGMIVYNGAISEQVLTISQKNLFSTIDIFVDQPTEIELLQKENLRLEQQSVVQDQAIDVTMVATMELYDMIYPPETTTPIAAYAQRKEVSKMVDFYVVAVQRGLRTIEQVPTRYREDVRAMLVQLEK